MLDVAWAALRGTLFTPWIYLPFVGHYAALFALLIVARSPALLRAVAWWLLVSMLVWSFVVRRFIA